MAHPQRIDPTDDARWARIRAEAEQARDATRDAGPNPTSDPLGALAWISQFPTTAPHTRWVEVVGIARAARRTWREIAHAIGEPDAELAVQQRYRERRARAAR